MIIALYAITRLLQKGIAFEYESMSTRARDMLCGGAALIR